jgi:aryl-alcohol dehydrogenase-like predicted oxidoreductase
MQYRTLGRTDIQVSTICMGCWGLAGDFHWGAQDDADSIATVHAALDAGVNFFDTAELYGGGRSDEVLGRALKGVRQEVVIAGKVAPQYLAPDDLVRSCEASLRRLDTDYIDLFQIHLPNWEIPIEETWAAMERLQQDGKVRAIGGSNFGVIDLTELLTVGQPASNQLPYSLLYRAIEYGVQQLCVENDVSILAYSPLMHGLLTGKYESADELPATRARTRHYSQDRPHTRHSEPGCEAETTAAIQEIRRISDEIGHSMTHVSLAWLLHQPGVASVITGMRRPEQARDSARAADLTLSTDVLHQLDLATRPVKEILGPNLDMWQTESRFR